MNAFDTSGPSKIAQTLKSHDTIVRRKLKEGKPTGFPTYSKAKPMEDWPKKVG